MFFKKHEYQIFEKAFGQQAGIIGWFQFLQAVKIPLNDKRKELVDNIYTFIKQQSEHLNPSAIGMTSSIQRIFSIQRGSNFTTAKK